MARQDIEAGRAFVKVAMDNSGLIKGIKAAQQRLASFGRAATATGGAIAGMGAAITGPLVAMAKTFADTGDKAGKMAARVRTSAEWLQQMGFAAEQSGASMDDVGAGLFRMTRRVANFTTGGGPAKRALEALGFAAKDFAGLNTEQTFDKVTEALSRVKDPALASQYAFELFGGTAKALAPLLAQGADGIAALRQEAKDLNIPLTNEEVADAEALTDALNRMGRTTKSLRDIIGSALAPTLTRNLNIMAKIVARISGWVRENKQLFATAAAVGSALTLVGTAIAGLGIASTVASAALGGILAVIGAIGTVAAAIASPLGLAATALIAGGVAWAKWTEQGQAFVQFARSGLAETLQIARDTFGGIVDALTAGDLELAAQIGFAGLKLAVAEGLNAIADLIGGAGGDTIASTFKDLLDGDLTGAMETALQGLQALFLDWGKNIVSIMTSVARDLVGIWRGASETIATSIDKQASKGGIFGKAFGALTGTDYTGTAQRGSELDRKLAESRQRLGITDIAADSTNADFIGGLYDQWESSINSQLDKLELATIQAADDAADQLKQRTREIGRTDTTDLANQLAALREQAAAAAEAARQSTASKITGGGPDGEGGGLGPGSQPVFGAFSAAAVAAVAASAGGPQQRLLKANEDQVRKLAAIEATEKSMLAALQNFGVTFQ